MHRAVSSLGTFVALTVVAFAASVAAQEASPAPSPSEAAPTGSNETAPYASDSTTTVPACPEGSYWDSGRQACFKPESPSPEPCPEGMYWDGGRQACVKPYDQPPPEPCGEGQYWDPDRQTCIPSDGYYHDSAMEECFPKMEAVKSELEALRLRMEERARAFHDEFAQARAAFASEPHSDEEWKAFMAGWMERGRAVFESAPQELETRMRELLGDCYDRMGMGGFGGSMPAPMNSIIQVPQFGLPPMEAPAFADLPPPPMATGGHFEWDAEAEQIRQECEARVRALVGEPPRPASTSSDGATEPMMPPALDAEMEQTMKEIFRECESRIRALFEERHKEFDREEGPDDFQERFGSLEMYFDEDLGRILVRGKFLGLQGNPETQMIESLTCDGPLFLDRLFVNGLLAEFRPEETGEGTALQIYDSSGHRILALHDNPRCVISVAASDEIPSITLDLADYLDVERLESGDLRFSAEANEGRVLLHGAEVSVGDGNVLVVTGKATFLVSAHDRSTAALGSHYEDAIEDNRVGAEVTIAAGADGLAVATVPLGDLDVAVEGRHDQVVAIIDSESGEGKTVVLEFERALFSTDDLRVTVVGVDASGNETALSVREASDLLDVLDPLDDGADAVEFWIVEDRNGFHVLVSFSHFSEKRVTVQSAGASAPSGTLVPGFEASLLVGALGLGMLAVGLRQRRRDA